MKKLLERFLKIFAIAVIGLIIALCCEGKVEALTDYGPGYLQGNLPYEVEFDDIAVGANHTIAIDDNGNLWGWGNNEYGQVGYGETFIYSVSPIKISENVQFKAVAAKDNRSLALDVDGNIWIWGNNSNGYLGPIDSTYVYRPTKLSLNTKFAKIFAGNNFNMAIDLQGNLWSWGANNKGQLGIGSTNNSSEPVRVQTNAIFTQVSLSNGFAAAIDTEGRLYTWGIMNYSSHGNQNGVTFSNRPSRFNISKVFTKVSAGKDFILAIDEEGNLWSFGSNDYGQLANGTTLANTSDFQKIITSVRFKEIQAGEYYALAIDQTGFLWSWGNNSNSQLGKGNSGGYDASPSRVNSNIKFEKIIAGATTAMAIDEKEKTWGWGNNEYGQIKQYGSDVYSPIKLTKKMYTVRFKSLGNVVKTEQVDKHEDATPPQNITLNGCTLQGWDPSYTNITQNTDINAVWGTSYKVEHYLEDENLTTYTKQEEHTEIIQNQIIGTVATATSKDFYGYTLNTAKSTMSAEVQQGGVTTLKLYYDRMRYTVTLNPNGGTINSGNITEYARGVGIQHLTTDVTRPGYTFVKWVDELGEDVSDYAIGVNETGAKTFTAVWEPNTNTPYSVVYYKENTDLSTYTKIEADTENYTGTTGELIITVVDEDKYEGFTLNEDKSITSGNILGDGSLELKVYYDRERYNVTLNANKGTIAEGKNITFYAYEVGRTLPTSQEITRPGYQFMGWFNEANQQKTEILNTERGDRTFIAKWAKNLNTSYKIEIYKQNIDFTDYVKDESATVNAVGETDEEIELTEFPEIVGFRINQNHSGNVTRGKIAGDGSLALKVYYDRERYNVTLNTNGGTINEGNVTEYVYGTETTLPTNIIKAGYTFSKWTDEEGNTVTKITASDTGNKVYTANWTANTNTNYKVEYYTQSESLKTYDLATEENKTGTTDSTVTLQVNENKYNHFIFNNERSITEGIIAGDGSLVLKLYYDRETYDLTLNTNGGSIIEGNIDKYVYGVNTILPIYVSKKDYVFQGWYDSNNVKVEVIEAGQTGAKEYTARWHMKDSQVEKDISNEYNLVVEETGACYITEINVGKEVDEMKYALRSIEGDVKILDRNRNEITENRYFRTGDILQITKDGLQYEYIIIVTGDINGDGTITTVDLSVMIYKIIGKIEFNHIETKAADIDKDGEITIVDLSKVIKIIMGQED